MIEAQELGYMVVFVNDAGRVDGLLSAKVKNFRDAHRERREWIARAGQGDTIAQLRQRSAQTRVAFVRGTVR